MDILTMNIILSKNINVHVPICCMEIYTYICIYIYIYVYLNVSQHTYMMKLNQLDKKSLEALDAFRSHKGLQLFINNHFRK